MKKLAKSAALVLALSCLFAGSARANIVTLDFDSILDGYVFGGANQFYSSQGIDLSTSTVSNVGVASFGAFLAHSLDNSLAAQAQLTITALDGRKISSVDFFTVGSVGVSDNGNPSGTGASGLCASASPVWCEVQYDSATGMGSNVSIVTINVGDAGLLDDITLTLTEPTTGHVPEPASIALAAIALGGGIVSRRRKTRQA